MTSDRPTRRRRSLIRDAFRALLHEWPTHLALQMLVTAAVLLVRVHEIAPELPDPDEWRGGNHGPWRRIPHLRDLVGSLIGCTMGAVFFGVVGALHRPRVWTIAMAVVSVIVWIVVGRTYYWLID